MSSIRLREVVQDDRLPSEPGQRRAAVAAVLRENGGDLQVLLIRRAEHPRDPWSGHMGFPGGRVDDDDDDPLAAAYRECREELDLDLMNSARLVGPLAHLQAIGRGRPQDMVIEPFVFFLSETPLFRLNHEVEETIWIPLEFFRNDKNRSRMPWQYQGATIQLPCYRYQGRVVWGLTLAMLDDLLARFA